MPPRKNRPPLAEPVRPSSANRRPVFGTVVLIGLLVILAAWTFERDNVNATQPIVNENLATILERISKHVLLDEEESPAIATIRDPEEMKLKDPIFFRHAETGDRLLIWPDKAILYSESRDLIIAFKDLGLSKSTETNGESGQKELELAKIEVRNGTRIPGLARQLVNKLSTVGFQVASPRDASKKAYSSTIIVKLADKPLPLTIAKLKNLTGAEEAELPDGELNVKGDVLIIIGTDYQQ